MQQSPNSIPKKFFEKILINPNESTLPLSSSKPSSITDSPSSKIYSPSSKIYSPSSSKSESKSKS